MPDGWHSPYAGKAYAGNARPGDPPSVVNDSGASRPWEVATMGIEELLKPGGGALAGDEEYRAFILGLLAEA